MNTTIENKETTVRFTSGVSLSDIISKEGAVFEIKYDNFVETENRAFIDNASDYLNFECLSIEDEDTYNESEPFQQLTEKMTDLIPSGKVKKRILREGVGDIVPVGGFVTSDYNAYVEYNPIPFDSTYARNRPFKCYLDEGWMLPGLEIGIKSMKVNEKSQFLIHPDLAYGKMGCLNRVPGDCQVLFEVEIKNCINQAPLKTFPNLNKDDQRKFKYVHEYAMALHTKGNSFFKSNLIKQAIKSYNTAVSQLNNCIVPDYNDQEIHQKLLLTLYANLVNAYTKANQPRKACLNANAAYHLSKVTNLEIPVKVYFHNARALMMIGDYDNAKMKLHIANRKVPANEEIGKELEKLEKLMKKQHERDLQWAKTIFKNANATTWKEKKDKITDEFKETLCEYFSELQKDLHNVQLNLPRDLNDAELNYVEGSAPQFDLKIANKDGQYCVYKEDATRD